MSERRWRQGQGTIHIELYEGKTAMEIHAAIEKLRRLLGENEQYYTWACTLPVNILMNNTTYLEAINRKIAEIEDGTD